jgi:hypothetical protein
VPLREALTASTPILPRKAEARRWPPEAGSIIVRTPPVHRRASLWEPTYTAHIHQYVIVRTNVSICPDSLAFASGKSIGGGLRDHPLHDVGDVDPVLLAQPRDQHELRLPNRVPHKVDDAVAEWIDRAGEEDQTLALEALQLAVRATRETATVTGVLPVEPPQFITIERTSA